MVKENPSRPKFKPESPDLMQPVYTRRLMTVYVIPTNELKTISHLNTVAMFCFSIGSFVLSFALGIYIDVAFSENAQNLSASAKALETWVGPILLFGSLLFYGLGIWQLITRRSVFKTIREESIEIKTEQTG